MQVFLLLIFIEFGKNGWRRGPFHRQNSLLYGFRVKLCCLRILFIDGVLFANRDFFIIGLISSMHVTQDGIALRTMYGVQGK